MEAPDQLVALSESLRQAAALLADDETTFLTAVVLGDVGAGKSAVLNSLIGHPVLPTGLDWATRVPIVVDLHKDPGLSTDSIVLENSVLQLVSELALLHALQDKLNSIRKGTCKSDEIYLNMRTSAGLPLKLIDLPGIDRVTDVSIINKYAGHNDALLIVVIPATQAADAASSQALRLAEDIDPDGTRTIGVLSKIDQASPDANTVSCVQAILSKKDAPRATAEIEWVALIGQSSVTAPDNSMETAWRVEAETLKSILTGAPQNKLGRTALIGTIAKQIRKRMKVLLSNLLTGEEGEKAGADSEEGEKTGADSEEVAPIGNKRGKEKRLDDDPPKKKKLKKTLQDKCAKRQSSKTSATSVVVDHVREEIAEMLDSVIQAGAEEGEHFYATQLLIKKEYRDVFSTLKTPNGKLAWLRRAWEAEGKCFDR